MIVSRGELIEIGGGFRIPDVLARVGRAAGRGRDDQPDPDGDYERAIGPETARSCGSTSRTSGSSASPRTSRRAELAALGRAAALPLVDDLGSGVARYAWLGDEPPCRDERSRRAPTSSPSPATSSSAARRRGSSSAAPTSSSGCGAIRSRARSAPDKMTLAALEETLALYRDPGGRRARCPALRMLARAGRRRARRWRSASPARRRRDRGDGRAASAAARFRSPSCRAYACSIGGGGRAARAPRRASRRSSPIVRDGRSCSTRARSRADEVERGRRDRGAAPAGGRARPEARSRSAPPATSITARPRSSGR